MSSRASISLVILILAWCLPASARADDDEAAVRATVALYFQAHATGDASFHTRAFHPEAELWSVKDGRMVREPVASYIARSNSGRPAPDEAQRVRRIDSVQVAGEVATVAVTLDYPTTLVRDFMTLLKLDGRWQIVNKTWHRAAKR
jgi:hypothetical protein